MAKRQNDVSSNLNHWDYINRYSVWMYHMYEKYIGKKVFDVGAGMGRMVKFYLSQCEQAVATDIFQSQVDYMNKRFSEYPNFQAVLFDIMADDAAAYENAFDTVICVNVLEHLEDDRQAILNMKRLLIRGGHIILLVPAFQKLYCDMDKNVGHYRRYNKGVLKELAGTCGMDVVENSYFNALGIIPYFLKGKRKLKEGESFSSNLNENNSKLYNYASAVLEPIEKRFPPAVGLSEIIIMRKREDN